MSDKKVSKGKPKESERGGQATSSRASGSGVSNMDTAPPAGASDPGLPDPFFQRLADLQIENEREFPGHQQGDPAPADVQSGSLGHPGMPNSGLVARRGSRGAFRGGRGGRSLYRGRGASHSVQRSSSYNWSYERAVLDQMNLQNRNMAMFLRGQIARRGIFRGRPSRGSTPRGLKRAGKRGGNTRVNNKSWRCVCGRWNRRQNGVCWECQYQRPPPTA